MYWQQWQDGWIVAMWICVNFDGGFLPRLHLTFSLLSWVIILNRMSMWASSIESTAKKVEGEFHDSNQVCRYVATQHNNYFYNMLEEKLQTDMEATSYMKVFIRILLCMVSIDHCSTSITKFQQLTTSLVQCNIINIS